jgi:hypothetical protein
MKKLSPVRIYSAGGPPPGTPITPGTQIILAEGVAGGGHAPSAVSLPQHPLPLESMAGSPVTFSISRLVLYQCCGSGIRCFFPPGSGFGMNFFRVPDLEGMSFGGIFLRILVLLFFFY